MGSRRGKGEGSIYQRDDGLWIGAVDLGWSSGKRARKVVNGRTRAEVAKRMQEVQPTVAQGLRLAPDRLTVEGYLAEWVANRIPGTVTTRTEALYVRAVNVYINPSVGKVRLIKLTPSDVSQMLVDLEAKGYSPATRRLWQGAQVLQHIVWQSSPQRAITELGFKLHPFVNEVVWPQVAARGRLDARLIGKLHDSHPLRIHPRCPVQ